jgi:hypothetical protein
MKAFLHPRVQEAQPRDLHTHFYPMATGTISTHSGTMLAFELEAQGSLSRSREREEEILRKHVDLGIKAMNRGDRERLNGLEAYRDFRRHEGLFNHPRPALQKFTRQFVRGLFEAVSTVYQYLFAP